MILKFPPLHRQDAHKADQKIVKNRIGYTKSLLKLYCYESFIKNTIYNKTNIKTIYIYIRKSINKLTKNCVIKKCIPLYTQYRLIVFH